MPRRWIVGPLLVAHGVLHLFGFLTSWDIIDVPGISRTPTIFTDDLPTGVIRDIGALWLLGMVTFSFAAYGAVKGYPWWKGVTFGSAIVSFIATMFWIHEAWPGTVLNAAIIVLIARSWRHSRANTRLDQPIERTQ